MNPNLPPNGDDDEFFDEVLEQGNIQANADNLRIAELLKFALLEQGAAVAIDVKTEDIPFSDSEKILTSNKSTNSQQIYIHNLLAACMSLDSYQGTYLQFNKDVFLDFCVLSPQEKILWLKAIDTLVKNNQQN